MAADTNYQESEAGESAEHEQAEGEPAKKKPSIKYWISQLDAATEAAKCNKDAAKEAWDEYLAATKSHDILSTEKESEPRVPVFWSSIRTMQPAVYSRTPVTVAQKAFDSMQDSVARIACIYLERLSKHLMRVNPFDRVMYVTRDVFFMSGKTAPRICFESDIKTETKKVYLQPMQGPDGQPTGQFAGDDGQVYPPDTPAKQDETGVFFEETKEILNAASCQVLPLYTEDMLHTPNARHQEEISWIAFYVPMTKDEAEDRFGKDFAEKLVYKAKGKDEDKSPKRKEPKLIYDQYAEIWEIWDKKTKQVYWLDRCYGQEFLDIKPDPYDLAGFFPVPAFMLGTVGCEDMYPQPDYIQLKPYLLQMHGIAKRIKGLVRATQVKGVADGNVPELQELAKGTGETEFLMINNFKELLGEADLSKLVKFFPTEKFIEAVQLLTQVLQSYEQKVYELYGLPDILRGVSDPRETAASQQLKGKFLSLRFSAIQREFQRLVRDTIELLCDLGLKKLPEADLQEIMGVANAPAEEQQLWPQVYELLKNDRKRQIRIELETDSTITMNEAAEIEQRQFLAKTIFDGLGAMGGISQQSPAMMPVIAQTVEYVVRGVRDGKQVEDALAAAIQQMMQPPPPPQPPPPDPIKMEELAIKREEVAIKGRDSEAEARLAVAELQLKELALQLQNAASSNKLAMDAQFKQFEQQLESIRVETERSKALMSEKEKLWTEQRLQRETQIKEIEAIRSSQTQQPIVVNVEPNKPKKRKVRIVHNDDDTSDVEWEEVPVGEK